MMVHEQRGDRPSFGWVYSEHDMLRDAKAIKQKLLGLDDGCTID